LKSTLVLCLATFGLFNPQPALCPTDIPLTHTAVFEQAANAQDRCCNPGCLARMTSGKKELVAKKLSSSNTVTIFFPENGSDLRGIDKQEIAEFIKSVNPKDEISVVGYTDGCGGNMSNKALSSRRAESTVKQIRSTGGKGKIKIISAGEISEGHDPKSRRVDIGISKSFKLYEPPPKIIADFYLIDGSGSMAGKNWKTYRRAISFHMPTNSKLYVATDVCVRNGINFDLLDPKGGTEIWLAYWTILDFMKPNQTLAVISDFDSTVPLKSSERMMIEQKIKEKGVSVSTFYVK